jgi:hypothetical protein
MSSSLEQVQQGKRAPRPRNADNNSTQTYGRKLDEQTRDQDLEIWDSFGIADGILKEAIPMSGSNSPSTRSQISILKNLRRILLLESR